MWSGLAFLRDLCGLWGWPATERPSDMYWCVCLRYDGVQCIFLRYVLCCWRDDGMKNR